ncbi:hypothetical protein [Pseudomonas sp. Snoq117.2]|uniref:hypothetical protein n=1 Tax=Pseudomonas sp. Snoq117.2 TaxID=1500302 RepID=UPI000B89054A|nr:hypothetical protein [Pseudomonas sp. Snoq117.2]
MAEEIGVGCFSETIDRLRAANKLMRSANVALALEDLDALNFLGFAAAHICELRERGGFRTSSIGQNTRLINRLLKESADAN